MAAIALPNVEWYVDREARARGEPGIYLSFISSLAGALRARGDAVDPVWLMGASGWAFRILMNEALCTSATSMFSFVEDLPDSVRNAGYD